MILHKLTSKGITHLVVPIFFIVAIGGIGAYVLSISHAATEGDAIQSGITGKCLDDFQDGSKTGTKVDIWTCNKTAAQQWTVTSTHQLKNNNGACLDNWQATKNNGALIKMYPCNTTAKGDAAEVWVPYEGGLENPASGKCLNDPQSKTNNGTELILYTCSSAKPKNQTWTIVAPPASTGGGGNGGGSSTAAGGGGGTVSSSAYTVTGNKIVNAAGKDVILHGVDRPSLEWSCSGEQVGGQGSGIPASDFTTMRKDWNADAVRIPVSEDRWLPNTADSCSTYQATVEAAVKNAEAAGMIAIVDLHWSDQGNNATASGQQCMPDQNSVAFWQQVATLYKGDPNVWFELYNEPYPPGNTQAAQWNTWLNGGTVTCKSTVGNTTGTWTAPGMQKLVNTVRATGANNIVLAGGLSYSSVLANVPTLTGGNVAYAVHPYINTSAPDGSTNGSWAANFGNQAAKAPVIATEFGDMTCGNATYDNAILSYFKSNDVGFTAWAWYAGGCSFPSIVSNAAGTCLPTMGCTIQKDMETYPADL